MADKKKKIKKIIRLKPDSHAAKRKKKMQAMMDELDAQESKPSEGNHGKIFDEIEGK